MKCLARLLVILLFAVPALAEITAFTDLDAFDQACGAQAYLTAYEGFEDDELWGHVRTTVVDGPHTAFSVMGNFSRWTANNPASGVTTGHGPALNGDWGFYQRPHGDPDNGVTDGWIISAPSFEPLFAVGGWFETNTFGARINFVIDGVTVVDFEDHPLDYAHQFYGVVVTEGFMTCEIVETEATPGDEWYYIFADSFILAIEQETAVGGVPLASARLLPNVPNPFNPRTTIRYELDRTASVVLRIHDAAGRLVRTLVSGQHRQAGRHEVVWDGRDTQGRTLPAGVYRCELVSDGIRSLQKLTMVK